MRQLIFWTAMKKTRVAAQTALALVSVGVLGLLGYDWGNYHTLVSGMSTADVLDPGVTSSPADAQNILLVGLDTRTDALGNPLPQNLLDQLHAGDAGDGGDNADTMIVVHIPAGGKNAVAFSIPRDSYVQLAGGFGKHKINSAYTYAEVAAENSLRAQGVSGQQLAVQAAQAAEKNVIQTVEQFTGLTINHFAAVNLVGFFDLSNALGGVPVCLNAPVHDSYSGANFPAGQQTVSGAQALAFVRQRHGLPDGDLDRIRRQQAFLASAAHTVLSAGTLANPAKLHALTGAIQQNVTLDQGWDVLSFAQQLRGLSSGNIQFRTIPVGTLALKTSDGDAVQVDPAQVQAAIRQATGEVPESTAASSTTPTPAPTQQSTPADSRSVVDIDNASGVPDLGAKVSRQLGGLGFTAGKLADVSPRPTTIVDYAPGGKTTAEKVAQSLGGVRLVVDPSLHSGQLRVYLGRDYAELSDVSVPAPSSAGTTNSAPPAQPITAGAANCVN